MIFVKIFQGNELKIILAPKILSKKKNNVLNIFIFFQDQKFPRSIKRKRYTDDEDWNGAGHSSGSDDEYITIKSKSYKRPKLNSAIANYTPNLDSYKQAKGKNIHALKRYDKFTLQILDS